MSYSHLVTRSWTSKEFSFQDRLYFRWSYPLISKYWYIVDSSLNVEILVGSSRPSNRVPSARPFVGT